MYKFYYVISHLVCWLVIVYDENGARGIHGEIKMEKKYISTLPPRYSLGTLPEIHFSY